MILVSFIVLECLYIVLFTLGLLNDTFVSMVDILIAKQIVCNESFIDGDFNI